MELGEVCKKINRSFKQMSTKIKSYKDIQGWFSGNNLFLSILDECDDNSETNILEVGTWLGKSTCYIASMAKVLKKPVKIYAVDTFAGEPTCEFQVGIVKENGGSIYNQFLKNVKDLELDDIIIPIVSDSHSCLRKCFSKYLVRSFDVISLDANHSYEYVKKDLEYLWPALKKGGLFCGDDYNGDVKKAVVEFANKYHLDVFSSGNYFVILKPL